MDRSDENETPKHREFPNNNQNPKDLPTFIEDQLLSEETRQLVMRKARRLVAVAGLPASYVDDVAGSMNVALVQAAKSYDPKLGDWLPFAERSLRYAWNNLLRDLFAPKRDFRRTVSLQVTVKTDDEGPTELAQLITRRELEVRTGTTTLDDVELSNLQLDMADFKASLPARLRELADALERDTILEVSRRTGTPRTTLYDRLELLRRAAEDRGLSRYLK